MDERRLPATRLHRRSKAARAIVRLRYPTAALRPLPTLLVLGAQRGGTSSLFKYLRGHPQVAASVRKEPGYFSRDFARGERWYRSHFPVKGHSREVVFEATPDYLLHPLAPRRAAELLPECRFVVLLRDPVRRAYSHYTHMVRLGFETLPFEEALEAEEARIATELDHIRDDDRFRPRDFLRYSYVSRGHYAGQLMEWFAHFPRDRFLIVRSEDFFSDAAASYSKVLAFLGLASWRPERFENRSRKSSVSSQEMPAEAAAYLTQHFGPHNERLYKLLGVDWRW